MATLTEHIKNKARQIKSDQTKSARRSLLEDLFNDYYERRHELYKMNFMRGIFFGLGSALGGTVVLAIIIWLATLILGPFWGDWLNQLRITNGS